MLRLVGLTNCSVLDGGFKSWTSLKLPVTDSIPPMAENYNNKYSYNSKYLVATENIMQLTNEEDFLLIDAREKVRFLLTKIWQKIIRRLLTLMEKVFIVAK